MSLVSIITVVKNDAAALQETLESVRKQSYSDIEMIVVDGGSDDLTLDVIHSYDELIDSWVSEVDEGIYDAMNKGVTMATGDWLHFLNAGDVYLHTQSLEKLLNCQSNSQLMVGNVMLGANQGQIVNYRCFERAGLLGTICHQAILFRASVFQERLYDTRFGLSADFDLLVELYLDNRSTFADYCDVDFVLYQGDGLSDQNARLALEERKMILDQRLKGAHRIANLLNVNRQLLKLKSA